MYVLREARSLIIVAVEMQQVLHVCVCVARGCARVGAQALGVCMRVRACSFSYLACKAYAPYCVYIRDPSGSAVFFEIIS
jgi:hypothetical protein